MVKFWEEEIKKAIKITKRRILHCEKHGIGDNAMKEKVTLQKQEKKLKDWRLNNS